MVSIFLNIPRNKPDATALSLVTDMNGTKSRRQESATKSKSPIETIITNSQLLQAKNKGRTQINAVFLTVYPSHRNDTPSEKLPIRALISLVVPATALLSCLIAFRVVDAGGWEAVFPSVSTCPIVFKLTTWMTLIAVVLYEQSFYHYGTGGKNLFLDGNGIYEGLEVVLDDGMLMMVDDEDEHEDDENVEDRKKSRNLEIDMDAYADLEDVLEEADGGKVSHRGGIDIPAHLLEDEIGIIGTESTNDSGTGSAVKSSSAQSLNSLSSSAGVNARTLSSKNATRGVANTPTNNAVSRNTPQSAQSNPDPPGLNNRVGSKTPASTPKSSATPKSASTPKGKRSASPPKAAPGSIPFRFIRATKGDVAAAKERWAATCKWRKENSMDTCLLEPHPHIKTIKANYPHYFHLRGKKNECCYYEKPAKMNVPELKKNGIGMEPLLKHYSICCDYMWTKIEDSEEGKSIYVIDLDGIGFRDFAGEVVDFVKKASTFTGDHYPERSGSIFVVNVPSWFSVIWNVVKPMVDDVTKQKITILRYGNEGITKALQEKIDIENIPPEYGGKSMPLGQSPEEIGFMKHFEALN